MHVLSKHDQQMDKSIHKSQTCMRYHQFIPNESQNISFIPKEQCHMRQQYSKLPLHAFINDDTYESKLVSMHEISTKVEGDMKTIAQKQR